MTELLGLAMLLVDDAKVDFGRRLRPGFAEDEEVETAIRVGTGQFN
jgi:hypothetical protein